MRHCPPIWRRCWNARASTGEAVVSLPTVPVRWSGLPAGVAALSTTRGGGVSESPYDDGTGGGGLNLALHVGDAADAVARNRALLRSQLPAEPAWLTQVHGTRVLDAASINDAPEADASITDRPGVVCAVMTADCLPVLLADAHGRVVGAAHAGWRGLAAGVLEKTVAAMRAAGAGDVLAWLGPAIGSDVFEVGEEVRAAFAHLGPQAADAFQTIDGRHGKYRANLPGLARLALAQAGVVAVAGGSDCTVSDPARFYSFRRDRVTGRMASLIWIS